MASSLPTYPGPFASTPRSERAYAPVSRPSGLGSVAASPAPARFVAFGALLFLLLFATLGRDHAANFLLLWLSAGALYFAASRFEDALCIFAFAIPLEQIFSIWGMGRYNSLAYLLLLMLLVRSMTRRTAGGPLAWPLVFALLWIAWRLLAIDWAPDLRSAAGALVVSLGGVLVLYAFSRYMPPREWSRALWFFLAGTALFSLVLLTYYDRAGYVWVESEQQWEYSVLGGEDLDISAPLLARLLSTGALVAFALAQVERLRWRKLTAAGLTILFGCATFLTLSRTNSVLLLVAFGVWGLLSRGISTRMRNVLAAALVVGTVWNLAWTFNPAAMDLRFNETITKLTEGDMVGLTAQRTSIWAVGAEIVRDHPIMGVGTGGWNHAYAEYKPGAQVLGSHNAYLQELVEGGLVGGGLLVLFVASLGLAAWRTREWKPTAVAMWVVFAAVLLSQPMERAKDGWFAMALVVTVASYANAYPRAGSGHGVEAGTPRA